MMYKMLDNGWWVFMWVILIIVVKIMIDIRIEMYDLLIICRVFNCAFSDVIRFMKYFIVCEVGLCLCIRKSCFKWNVYLL